LMSKVHNWRVFFSSARILNFWTAEDTYRFTVARAV
jgi:hypothetical protein